MSWVKKIEKKKGTKYVKRSTPAKYTPNPHPPSSRPNFTKRGFHRINGHHKGSLPKKQTFSGTLYPPEVSLALRDLADNHFSLQMARIELDCNLKKFAHFFQVRFANFEETAKN